MKIGQNFSQIGTIERGDVIIKLPGTDIIMPYETGEAFLSKSGIGYVSLPIREIKCAENGEPEGLFGELGRQLAGQLSDPTIQKLMKQALATQDHFLFYSLRKDGVEVLTIPGTSGKDTIDTENMPNMVVAAYSSKGDLPSVEEVYAYHMKAVGKKKLVTDRKALEKEVLQLVPKANGVYERALQLMKELGF